MTNSYDLSVDSLVGNRLQHLEPSQWLKYNDPHRQYKLALRERAAFLEAMDRRISWGCRSFASVDLMKILMTPVFGRSERKPLPALRRKYSEKGISLTEITWGEVLFPTTYESQGIGRDLRRVIRDFHDRAIKFGELQGLTIFPVPPGQQGLRLREAQVVQFLSDVRCFPHAFENLLNFSYSELDQRLAYLQAVLSSGMPGFREYQSELRIALYVFRTYNRYADDLFLGRR